MPVHRKSKYIVAQLALKVFCRYLDGTLQVPS